MYYSLFQNKLFNKNDVIKYFPQNVFGIFTSIKRSNKLNDFDTSNLDIFIDDEDQIDQLVDPLADPFDDPFIDENIDEVIDEIIESKNIKPKKFKSTNVSAK